MLNNVCHIYWRIARSVPHSAFAAHLAAALPGLPSRADVSPSSACGINPSAAMLPLNALMR